ncbi:MAG: hypothetical protein PHP82_00195 [Candidatus ainarchaeum sp.]|nr:hypothetical protein [Candidatus ainarchaeum sp.]
MNKMLEGLLVGFITFCLLSSNPAIAFSLENNSVSNNIFFEETVSQDSSNEFRCDISSLTPLESKQIMNLTKDNFQGKEINDDKNEKATGIDLDDLELIGQDNDGETAVKQSAPSKAASADRFSFLDSRTVSGPFGIGLVLDDTLRVGTCVDSAQEDCRVYGNGLAYRTSGKGLTNMFVDNTSRFEDLAKQGISGVSEEEYVRMQNQVFSSYDLSDDSEEGVENEINNDFAIQTTKLDPTDQIPNSFRTNQYTTKNATNCNNASCIISSYSAFDKIYNQWYSADIVVTSFGPALLNSAGRWLNLTGSGPAGGAQNRVVKFFNEKVFRSGRDALGDVPSALLGKNRIDNYQQLIKKNGFGEYFTEFTVGGKAFSSGAAGYTDALLGPNSPLNNLTPDQKKAFFRALQDVKAYANASSTQMSAAKKAFLSSAQTYDDLMSYAKTVSKQVKDWDDVTFLDFPAWIQKNPDLTGLQGLAVKKAGFTADSGFVDITSSQPYNFTKGILTPFAEKGNWDDYAGAIGSFDYQYELGSAIGATGHTGIKLFKPTPSKLEAAGVNVADLQSYVAKLGDSLYTVNIPGVGQMPLNASTVNYIKDSPGILGTVDIYSSKYDYVKDLMPEDFANIITNGRIVSRPNTALINFSDLDAGLREKADFVSRRSLNALDSLFASENKIIQDYFTFKANTSAFYKVAIGPMMLWNVKRGFGNEKFSAFMLPDSWTTMTISQGIDDVYKRSFTDFYANEGSDQGELFSKVINSFIFFPNYLAKEIADNLSPQIGDKLRAFSGEYGLDGGIMRDEVKNIAFYSHNENCSGCTMSINSNDDYSRFDIQSPVNIKSFIVEAIDPETIKEDGTTLIVYTHGSNIKGSTADIEGQEINLSQAKREGTTCDQVLRENNLGWAGKYTGFVTASLESVGYFINPGIGLLATGAQQVLIAPKLQDCVDDVDGYYIHFYSPPPAQQVNSKTKESLSSEGVSSTISDLSKNIDDLASQDNPVADSIGKIKEEFENFANQAKNDNILQATIELLPPISGGVTGKEIFYIWFKDTLLPTGLKTSGKSLTTDGNIEIVKDFDNGDLLIDGKKIVEDKKEIIGLTIQENKIPAELIPKTVSISSMPNTTETVFELNVLGEVRVKEALVRNCIQDAIKKQSGITYNGDELTQVFGDLKAINTEKYGNVFVRDGKIQLEGTVPVYGTINAKFIINGFWDSRLEQDANRIVDAGKFIGMAFEHGSIVLNPETNEIIIWLRQHKEAVLSSKEVSGLKAKLSSILDPETDCEQPALELEAQGYPNDQLGLQRVDNFNTSMKHLGPFTQFTTDGKIFEFYAERDPETGECVDYFRVTDKETGKILVDSPIVGGVTQDADGKISFRTADGKTHTLDFSADNGIPKLSYNNGPAETLRTAQGTNGSFWFDPNTGQWYPENSMQIPLNQAFKDQGAYYGVDKEGNVSGTAGNPMTFNIGQQEGTGFNIPSLPQTIPSLILFITLFLTISFVLTQKKNKNNLKK